MRLALTTLVLTAGPMASTPRADTGDYHHCQIEGEVSAEIYMDANGRNVTFDVRGEHHEIRAKEAVSNSAQAHAPTLSTYG